MFIFFHFRGFAFVQFKDPKQANAVKFPFYKLLLTRSWIMLLISKSLLRQACGNFFQTLKTMSEALRWGLESGLTYYSNFWTEATGFRCGLLFFEKCSGLIFSVSRVAYFSHDWKSGQGNIFKWQSTSH